MANTPTYWDYLRLDQLLELQGGVEGTEEGQLADELHFIVVHQAYELWFKLVLRSVRLAISHLDQPRVDEETIPHVVHHLRRINTILRLGVAQFEVEHDFAVDVAEEHEVGHPDLGSGLRLFLAADGGHAGP